MREKTKKWKQVGRLLLVVVFFCTLLCGGNVKAEELTNGNWKYVILDGSNVTITRYNGKEEHVIVPSKIEGKTVTRIGYQAFAMRDSIKSVVIPECVTEIGEEAFADCTNLTSINLPEALTRVEDGVFNYCLSLTNVTIPKNVTHIGWMAFRSCTQLKSIEIPEGVTEIEGCAFYSCESLESIKIPKSVTSIGAGAFFSTQWMVNKYEINPMVIVNDILIDARLCEGNVHIPDGVKSISGMAFEGEVESISIPQSVNYIGEDAFPASWIEQKKKQNPLVIINDIVVDGTDCTGDIVLPSTVKSIAGSAFEYSDISSIQIPEGVTSIGRNAFENCSKLKEIVIPDSVTFIGDFAFSCCESLEQIKLSSSLTFINSDVFLGCKSLTNITIPNSVTEIEMRAFDECSKLRNVSISSDKIKIFEFAFGECKLTNVEMNTDNIKIYHRAIDNNDDLVISLIKDSGAEYYAQFNGIKYRYIGGDSSAIINPDKSSNDKDFSTDSTIYPTSSLFNTDNKNEVVLENGNDEKKKSTILIPTVTKVKNFKATPKKKGFSLTWKQLSGVNGYEIQVSTKKNFKNAKTYTASKKKYSVSKLKAKTKYYIRIRAYKTYQDADGKTQKAYGKYTTVNKKTK